MLLNIFIHDNGSGNTDIEALHTAILRDFQGFDFFIILQAKTQTEFFIAKYKSASGRQLNLQERFAVFRLQGKQRIFASGQILIAAVKIIVKSGGYIFEGSLGGSRIEEGSPDYVNLAGTKRVSASKNFSDVECRL